MANDTNSLYAQERSSTVFRVVHPFLEALESFSGKSITHLGGNRAGKSFLQHTRYRLNSAFADLQNDVTNKTITNDYFHAAVVKITPFHVTDKIRRKLFEQRQRLTRQIISLVLFFADGEQRDGQRLRAPPAQSWQWS